MVRFLMIICCFCVFSGSVLAQDEVVASLKTDQAEQDPVMALEQELGGVLKEIEGVYAEIEQINQERALREHALVYENEDNLRIQKEIKRLEAELLELRGQLKAREKADSALNEIDGRRKEQFALLADLQEQARLIRQEIKSAEYRGE